MGFFSSYRKFRMTCLIESVDSTVEIPSLVPSKEASVLLPVPEVPASKTMTFILDCMSRDASKKSLMLSCFWYWFARKHQSRSSLKMGTDVVTWVISRAFLSLWLFSELFWELFNSNTYGPSRLLSFCFGWGDSSASPGWNMVWNSGSPCILVRISLMSLKTLSDICLAFQDLHPFMTWHVDFMDSLLYFLTTSVNLTLNSGWPSMKSLGVNLFRIDTCLVSLLSFVGSGELSTFSGFGEAD